MAQSLSKYSVFLGSKAQVSGGVSQCTAPTWWELCSHKGTVFGCTQEATEEGEKALGFTVSSRWPVIWTLCEGLTFTLRKDLHK